ncbi:MAG: hypothetical protein GX256_00550 [Fretibacterium sp.]|nr:hypothetical protein [Fretibacterium sp.]
MNITSIFSNGYLQPAQRPRAPEAHLSGREAASPARSSLATQESSILAQERSIKMAAGPSVDVSVVYHYTPGPDGRRYISGATLTLKGDAKAVSRAAGGVSVNIVDEDENSSEATGAPSASKAPGRTNPKMDAAVRELQQIEREVIAHEAAHQAAAGRFGGPVRYTRTTGPDGRSYITGGSVPIHVPATNDPEEALRNMEQVQRAALAPGDPSGQDLQVAARAAASATQIRQQLAAKRSETGDVEQSDSFLKSGISSIRALMSFDALSQAGSEGFRLGPAADPLDPSAIRAAYERHSTQKRPEPSSLPTLAMAI